MRLYKKIFLGIVISSIALYTYLFSMTPSLSRDWQDDQKVLTKIEFTDDSILLRDIRNFIYESTSKYTPAYYDGVYNIADVESVYYIIEPFWNIDGFAHTMLSFGLIDGRYITISAEIRKQVGESFHPLKGLFNAYEIVYIIWDESDLIKLRANYRNDIVRLYPIKANKKDIQKLFVSVLQRADKLSKHPEFYNTLTNNCTTNILDHVNELKRENNNSLLRWWRNILLPEYSDEIAYELWLINTQLSLEDAREYYTINELSNLYTPDQNYSKLIRKEIR